MQRNFGLDVLRAAAILGVLLLHALQAVSGVPVFLTPLFERGWVGVDLFFVLSGYLIASQVFAVPFQLWNWFEVRRFWLRRWTRTLPLYLLVLFVYAVVKPAIFSAPFAGLTWKYLFFFQNTDLIQDFVQSWSLCIEEQFYLVFPLAALLFRPRTARAGLLFLVPLLLSLAYRAYLFTTLPSTLSLAESDFYFRFRTFSHLDSIAVGVTLAATRETWQSFRASTKRALGGLGLMILIFTLGLMPPLATGAWVIAVFSLLAIGFGLLLIWAESWRPIHALNPIVTRVALWSYGAYLWNNLIMRFWSRYPIYDHWLFGMLTFLAATLIFSAITYHWIEKPGMRLRSLLKA